MPRHIIKPEHRGKKPTLNPGEASKPYFLKMPVSLWQWCHDKGPRAIRGVLQGAKEAESLILDSHDPNNSGYHYWFPGEECPSDNPESCELLLESGWISSLCEVETWKRYIRRWPK